MVVLRKVKQMDFTWKHYQKQLPCAIIITELSCSTFVKSLRVNSEKNSSTSKENLNVFI